eukprot:s4909_g1.t1
MCSIYSAVSGELLAVVEELKKILADQLGVTRFRQKFMSEEGSREILDDEVFAPPPAKVQHFKVLVPAFLSHFEVLVPAFLSHFEVLVPTLFPFLSHFEVLVPTLFPFLSHFEVLVPTLFPFLSRFEVLVPTLFHFVPSLVPL